MGFMFSAEEVTPAVLAFFACDRIDVVLFVAAFISASLAPGGSEVFFAGALAASPERFLWFLLVASAGNTLGAMTSWGIGRFIPTTKTTPRAVAWLRRWGAWALLFSWLPIVGDALPLAAGWLRIDFWKTLLAIAVGKTLRYAAIALMVLPTVT